MAIADFVAALGFGIAATGAVTIFPGMVVPTIIGSFILSFFLKWLFGYFWEFLLSLKIWGFYITCLIAGILIMIGVAIFNIQTFNVWLIVNSACWIVLAVFLVKSFADKVLYFG